VFTCDADILPLVLFLRPVRSARRLTPRMRLAPAGGVSRSPSGTALRPLHSHRHSMTPTPPPLPLMAPRSPSSPVSSHILWVSRTEVRPRGKIAPPRAGTLRPAFRFRTHRSWEDRTAQRRPSTRVPAAAFNCVNMQVSPTRQAAVSAPLAPTT